MSRRHIPDKVAEELYKRCIAAVRGPFFLLHPDLLLLCYQTSYCNAFPPRSVTDPQLRIRHTHHLTDRTGKASEHSSRNAARCWRSRTCGWRSGL
jgi:hypothetical protein